MSTSLFFFTNFVKKNIKLDLLIFNKVQNSLSSQLNPLIKNKTQIFLDHGIFTEE